MWLFSVLACLSVGCAPAVAAHSRSGQRHFETIQAEKEIFLQVESLDKSLFREPEFSVELKNRYEDTGLKDFIARLLEHHGALKSGKRDAAAKAHQELLNFHNSQYFGEIQVGTPAAPFVVVRPTESGLPATVSRPDQRSASTQFGSVNPQHTFEGHRPQWFPVISLGEHALARPVPTPNFQQYRFRLLVRT
ncbi:aspartyl proteinase [Cystoisospora suis]|uniref:Aspartyl proteinase n=1 Tax=Cystoisospora suis TaxID=483139 RepID=A0A2C6JYP1_9APIC|nr:aspartyl proteinase [Cystoisospora suis]